MSDPSDKSRRDGESGPLPRTNRPRPEQGRRRGRAQGPAGSSTETPSPVSEQSSPDSFIANVDEKCEGKWIKLSAQSNGSFTVVNARNKFEKTYKR